MHYRSDVDGLRAVAILPVILFHAGLGPFTGGYVGVDVFFVISGFLITEILSRDLDDNRFSILKFYERRARRLFPALAAVLVATTICLFYVGFPEDLHTYSESLVYVSSFAANFYFWQNLGYFDLTADMQPLLHMWSLAVEEQYYILFPFLLLALSRRSEKTQTRWLWSFLLVSFGLCVAGIANYPAATFFSLPTRAWELLAGGLVALRIRQSPSKGRGLWAGIGLVLILIAVFSFEEKTPFPSHFTLLPVVGTVLVLRYSEPGQTVYKILSFRPFVAIGLISYSAYLWHQPIIVLARIDLGHEPSALQMFGCVVFTFALAALTWKFIEQPFRRKKSRLLSGSRSMLATAIGGLIAFVILGLSGQHTGGFQLVWQKLVNREGVSITTLIQSRNEILPDPYPGECRFSIEEDKDNLVRVADLSARFIKCYETHGPGVAVIGDSHAEDLYRAIRVTSEKPFLVGLTYAGCSPGNNPKKCQFIELRDLLESHPNMFAAIIHEQMARVLFIDPKTKKRPTRSGMTRMPLDASFPESYILDVNLIRNTQEYLATFPGNAEIYWLGPRMEPYIGTRAIAKLGCNYPYKLRRNAQEMFETLDQKIAEVSRSESFTYLSQLELLNIKIPEDLLSCDALYFRDGDHLTSAGEKRFGARLDLINRLGLN